MTNQSTALRDPEREPERLRPPIHSSACKTEPLDATKRLESDQCSPSPTRLQSPSPSSIPIFPRKSNRDYIELPASLNSDHTTTSGVIPDERIRCGKTQSEGLDDDEDEAMLNDVGEFQMQFCRIFIFILLLLISSYTSSGDFDTNCENIYIDIAFPAR